MQTSHLGTANTIDIDICIRSENLHRTRQCAEKQENDILEVLVLTNWIQTCAIQS
jgi:hypothetical protein